jgi:hypothetical protein
MLRQLRAQKPNIQAGQITKKQRNPGRKGAGPVMMMTSENMIVMCDVTSTTKGRILKAIVPEIARLRRPHSEATNLRQMKASRTINAAIPCSSDMVETTVPAYPNTAVLDAA